MFARLADEATRIATQHLAGVTPLRRDAILAAGVIALETDLVDAALAMFEKLMAQYGRAAERRVDERAARSMREIQGDLRLFAVSGRALVDAHVRKQDLGVALQTAVGWRHFESGTGCKPVSLKVQGNPHLMRSPFSTGCSNGKSMRAWE